MEDNFVQDDQSCDLFDLILHIKIYSQEVEVIIYQIEINFVYLFSVNIYVIRQNGIKKVFRDENI